MRNLLILVAGAMLALLTPSAALAQGEPCDNAKLLDLAEEAKSVGHYGVQLNRAMCQVTIIFEGPPVPAAPVTVTVPVTLTATMAVPAAEVPEFSTFVGNPYALIAILDSQEAKVPQGQVPYTIQAEEDLLYWTGAYLSGSLPSGFEPLLVDGQTGVFLVRQNTTVTINFVGSWMPVSKFDSSITPTTVDDVAESCVPTQTVVNLLNQYATTDGEQLFRELDSLVNVEGAPYLGARFRPEPLEAKTYTDLTPATVIMWTQTGQVGSDSAELAQSNGKSAYLNTEPRFELTHAHTGLLLCGPMNPADDLSYWGK